MAINVKDKLVTVESLGIAYSTEQGARQEADQALSTRIDNIVAPEGDPSLTEVSDARVSGQTTYNTLKARLDADQTAVGTEISALKADLDNTLAKTNGQIALGIEVGTINLDGTDGSSTTRARTNHPFTGSFILVLNDGYKIKNVFRYNYDENGNLVYSGYAKYNQSIFVLMGGKWISGTAASGDSADATADAFRLSFSKSDDTQTITSSDIDDIVSVCKIVNTDKTVKLTGFGTSGGQAGAVSVGDIYYNTSTKKLRILASGSAYYTVPYSSDSMYVCQNHAYVWNGTDLVRIDADVVTNVNSLQSSVESAQGDISVINNELESQKNIVFVQGGISLSGQDDDSASATRIRTDFLNLYAHVDFEVSNGYQARIALYDKGEKFVRLTDYGTSFKDVDGETYLARLLVKHTDGSNILASEMILGETYSFNALKTIRENVLPAHFSTPSIGTTSLYTSSALERTEIDSKTSAQLFQEYDSMVSQYPRFFEREDDIGVDAFGNSIRAYTLRFTSAAVYEGESGATNVWDDSYNYKTILITSGVHGGEKTASWGLMLAIKDILESNADWARYIKTNLILKIVPCVNVWGFDNNSRLNYKEVNINRDAYTWASEEGQALKDWYDSNLDAVYYMDIHGTSGARGYQEIWKLSPYKKIHCQNCAKIGASMYSEWMTKFGKYPTFPAIISTFSGLLVSYTEAYGIPSSIIEVPRDIVNGSQDNYLDACAFCKDVVVNMIQGCGQTAFGAWYTL